MSERIFERIFIGVAWPYANGPLHIGHLAGAYIPPDIFARYHRMRGNRVLMVSGSDEHGTPNTVSAERLGMPPRDFVRQQHAGIAASLVALGISFDLFTETHTDNHIAASQWFFRALRANDLISRAVTQAFYDERAGRFLPDRYIEGTCPHCGYTRARGDQCDSCGRTLDPVDLIGPRSTLTGATPVIRDTEHFFLELPRLEPRLRAYVEAHPHWRPNVRNFTSNWLREGLRARAITRDIEWGVPVPVDEPGFADKRLYVWFDAVIGYYSASLEWAARQGDPDAWRPWWQPRDDGVPTRSYYFIGKDNIPFHTIIWPGMLLGVGGLHLPHDVPANEFLNLEGRKMSTSQNFAVWLPEYLSRYEPDPLRYFLTVNAPEARDADFSWRAFYQRNNDELVATYGNAVNRVLSFVGRHFGGRVPEPGVPDEADRALLAQATGAFDAVGALIEACRFKEALREVMAVAQALNRYIDAKAPWTAIRSDHVAAGATLNVCLQVIGCLAVLTAPFLPHSAQRLWEMLGAPGVVSARPRLSEPVGAPDMGLNRTVVALDAEVGAAWRPLALATGHHLGTPAPLFKKLDEAAWEEETARLLERLSGAEPPGR
jgi:methionyl-tRNA synthetase